MSESDESPSRRVFLHRLSFLGGGVVLLGGCKREQAQEPAVQRPRTAGKKPSFPTVAKSGQTFTTAEAATLRAAVDRVLPRDEDPGALDADVPVYIDRMLATEELRTLREDFVQGLGALDRRSGSMFQAGFAQATPAQQDTLLTLFKDSAPGSAEAKFYELLVVLTLEGFLGDPSYGGNKEHVGWALVGFGTSEPAPGYDGVRHLRHGHAQGEGAAERTRAFGAHGGEHAGHAHPHPAGEANGHGAAHGHDAHAAPDGHAEHGAHGPGGAPESDDGGRDGAGARGR